MSKHVTYGGKTIDMDSMRRENAMVPAVGNAKTNARGDQLKNGVVTRTADEIARERGRIQSVIVNTGLKGAVPTPPTPIENARPVPKATKKAKETELPSGDIVVEDGTE